MTVVNPDAAKPPAAERRPTIVGLHGDKIEDSYFWLREKENPAVLTHLQAENAYTKAVLAPFEKFESALYQEMLGRIQQTDASAPYSQRSYWLYTRTEEGKQYPIFCRKKGAVEAAEEVVLDVNALVQGRKFMAVNSVVYSDDNTLLAYATDINGHRDYDFQLKNLLTGEMMKTPIGKVASVVWGADNKTIFFVTEDPAKRPSSLWRYTLGAKEPLLIYEEQDRLFSLRLDRSRDEKFLFAGSASSRTTEFRFLPADQPNADWQVIAARRDEIKYYPEHRNGLFYLRTNDGAKEFRVVTAPVSSPVLKEWKEFIPTRPGVTIEDLELFAHHAVIVEREEGLIHFRVLDFARGNSQRIDLPEPAYLARSEHNAEFATTVFRFSYESPVTPPSVFAFDMASGERKLLKRTQVLGGYDPSRYVVERLRVQATDGTRIPLDLVRKKDMAIDGTARCWLLGYGSYGLSIDPAFSSHRISLLDREVIFALAHVRGGGELGEAWHDGARMMTKKNSFTDFVACTDFLVAQRYTAHDRMVIEGRSAGGLLIGATLNLRPDVAKAAILDVPFVDVLNTMSDPTLPLTTGEYIEWGNPNNRVEYDYIKSYSPYDNLAAKDYPAILLRTSLNDSQVPYWEPAKFAAKLRELKTDKNPLLFKINLEAGHGGSSGRYDRLKEIAFEYTFGLGALGLVP